MTDEGGGTPPSGTDPGREKTGTFLVTHVDDDSAILRDVHDAEVHTIDGSHDFETREIVRATLVAEPPMAVVWSIVEVADRRSIPVEESPEAPTRLARDMAAEHDVGEVATHERAGEGEVHVLRVPEDRTEAAATDVLEDEETVARAARLGVDRVEVRADAGVVSVRYLP